MRATLMTSWMVLVRRCSWPVAVAVGFALVFDEHDRHQTLDVLAGDAAEQARALAVERDVHRRLSALAVEAGGGVYDVLAGDHHLLFQQHRLAVALAEQLRAGRRAPAGDGARRVVLLGDHAKLKGRGRA